MFKMMTKLIKISITVLILISFTSLSLAGGDSWREYKSTHFIISYHPSIPDKYIREFSRKCEQYYQLIAERLGVRRFNYWSWDNRARVLIYSSRQELIKHKDWLEWTKALVYVRKKLIMTYCFEEELFDIVLPHEIAHIVLRELIGLEAKVPLWFEEGVACTNEADHQRYLAATKELFAQGAYLSVARLERVHNRATKSKAHTMFYPMAASLIIFLQENYNQQDFLQLCRELRDGNSFYKALNKVYGIKNAQDLQDKFLTYLSEQ